MEKSNFALRLLPSLHKAAQRIAERENCSVNQLINLALAEKIAVLDADYWDERKKAAAKRPRTNVLKRLEHATLLSQRGEYLLKPVELPQGTPSSHLRLGQRSMRSCELAHPRARPIKLPLFPVRSELAAVREDAGAVKVETVLELKKLRALNLPDN